MRRLTPAILVLGLLALSAPALAQETTFTIGPIAGSASGAEGDVIQIAEEAVDPALVGSTCTVTSSTENNSSVHPGNTLILSTGDTSGEIAGVEEMPGQTLNLSGSVTLGETVVVSLRFGPDGLTSGGVTLTFACAAVEETTTTTAGDTTTTVADTTTTAPAAVGGVATGAGGTAESGSPALLLISLGIVALAGAGGLLVWRQRTLER